MGKKLLVLILLIIMLPVSEVCAETVNWNFSGGGSVSWNTAANWDPVKIPQPGDDVSINSLLTDIITVNSESIVEKLTMGGGHKIVVQGNKLYISSAPLKVFVTSVTGSGNLGAWPNAGGQTGLDAGDAICQARATAAGLPGTFRAWLSDKNNDAYCRLHNLTGQKASYCGQTILPASAGPWVRTDGFPFSTTIDGLVNKGEIYSPIRFDEYGNAVTTYIFNFANTTPDGVYDTYYDYLSNAPCNGWTSAAVDDVGGGDANATTYTWTEYGNNCSSTSPLFCFQTVNGPSLPTFKSAGKNVFVTSISGIGNLGAWEDAGGQTGLAAGDAICQARAAAGGLTGSYKAWLSTDSQNAKGRFTSNGPWVRLDGVKIAGSKADLTDGSLFTSINIDELGEYTSYAAWTGTNSDGTMFAQHCNNWTDGTDSFSALGGRTSDAGGAWTSAWSSVPCKFNYSLYCFED